MYLYDKLNQYAKEGYYPFHMPGHKRNLELMGNFNPYEIDLTEIDGFDNMHDAHDVIKESMERAANFYHSKHTYYLVNGSTSGILTGICGCTKKGDKILIARNCHKSAYQAIFVNELNPVYLYPQYNQEKGIQCGYSVNYIEDMLIKNPDTALVVLVSPTYEGVISEIEQISKLVHKYNIPLLVDEAHGAHFGMHESLPKSSVELGADIVIHSVHKTLPAFTQTALIHVNSSIVDLDKMKYYYSIFQSSSPSYIMMSGIDRCIDLLEKRGTELFEEMYQNMMRFYDTVKLLKYLCVIEPNEGRDYSKILISTRRSNMTGPMLYDILINKYKIQMEMVLKDYVLGIATIADTKDGFKRLETALFEIDQTLESSQEELSQAACYEEIHSEVVLNPYQVLHASKKKLDFYNSENEIAGEFVNVYPPGIPVLAPGERISKEIIEKIEQWIHAGLDVQGIKEKKYILIVNREEEKCQK